ncbi:MAG: hypothetical protein J6A45_03515 [Lachnospiraceae bacterium]|nr:hypothetical protein [Lachnospiraceae bacterium]
MHIVGKLDKSIYSCMGEVFITDEVIITNEQLQHVKERHPEVYDNILGYIEIILNSPDYIIEDTKHKHSAMVIKKMETEKEHNLLLLRICTAKDSIGYKNSIITSWEISEKRLNNYLRNKKILYRKA